MTLTRWDPFREFDDMSQRFNRMFGRASLARRNEDLALPDWQPSVDIKETAEAFVIKADLPEVKKEDIKISVENGVLTLRGERKTEKEEKDAKYHRVERAYGSFMRSFALPENVVQDKIKADSSDGLLTITLTKSAEKKPKSVEVKVS